MRFFFNDLQLNHPKTNYNAGNYPFLNLDSPEFFNDDEGVATCGWRSSTGIYYGAIWRYLWDRNFHQLPNKEDEVEDFVVNGDFRTFDAHVQSININPSVSPDNGSFSLSDVATISLKTYVSSPLEKTTFKIPNVTHVPSIITLIDPDI